MSRDRFCQLKSVLHTVPLSEKDEENALWRIESFFKGFFRRSQKFWRLNEFVSQDEIMIRFSGGSKMTFSQQPKPTPNGFKVIGVVDSVSSYVFNSVIDSREKNQNPS